MHKIIAGTIPSSVVGLQSSNADFSQLSSNPVVRRALWDEQGGMCAYCERRLRNVDRPDHATRIEHFHPQGSSGWGYHCALCSDSTDNQSAPVSWGNLLLCCDGNERAGQEFTCDKSKGSTDICAIFRNPKSSAPPLLVEIDRAGRGVAVQSMPIGSQRVVDEILNLNSASLVQTRKKILSSLAREINKKRSQKKGLSKKARKQLASRVQKLAIENGGYVSTYETIIAKVQ